MGSEAEDYGGLEPERPDPGDDEPVINNNSDGKIQILVGSSVQLINPNSIG